MYAAIASIVLLAFALAIDCFTVSVTCGLITRRMGRQVWVMASLFGFFQGVMPLAGWLAADFLSNSITAYDHWVSFGLLAAIGGKMIWEGCRKETSQRPHFNPSKPSVLLALAVATSIDALAVGFSFIGMGIRTWGAACPVILFIALVSFLMSLLGKYIGVRLGRHINWPAEQTAGVVLILIGLRTLIGHMS